MINVICCSVWVTTPEYDQPHVFTIEGVSGGVDSFTRYTLAGGEENCVMVNLRCDDATLVLIENDPLVVVMISETEEVL